LCFWGTFLRLVLSYSLLLTESEWPDV
jgi:hypothetical protein